MFVSDNEDNQSFDCSHTANVMSDNENESEGKNSENEEEKTSSRKINIVVFQSTIQWRSSQTNPLTCQPYVKNCKETQFDYIDNLWSTAEDMAQWS